MTTIGDYCMTLTDWSKRVDEDGSIATIVETLSSTNEILIDAQFIESNLPTGHRTTIRSGLPGATWRLLNKGVQPSKSTTVQVTDTCGMLEAYSEVDKALADLNGNTSEFRFSEDVAFLESMNQEMAKMMFYGNAAIKPEAIHGLSPRFSSLSAENGEMIVNGGSTTPGVNTSIWFVVWGPLTCHGIFAKGTRAGFTHTDLGEVTLFDADGGRYQGYRTHYKWNVGLSVRDWRYVARVANLDSTTFSNAGTASYIGPELINLMVIAYNKLKNPGMGNAAIYCNQHVKTTLDLIALNKNNVNLSIESYAGKPTTMFWGIPIRRCDALLNTEDLVS